ncbi:MAG: hypothetical protein Q7S05_04270 [bacterium]|nr:hypothetical protein [bacterium]
MSIETIGPDELKAMPKFNFGALEAPRVPWSAEELNRREGTHLLVFTPKTCAGTAITLDFLRELFGVDPAVSEPCMYNQDWYLKEDFATKTALDGTWHLIRKDVLEGARAKLPEDIEHDLMGEQFPTAVTYVFTFFAYWLATGGKVLWKNDFLWCSDRDHNGDRVYVGCYEDPAGMNKNGFNIHRHLALRPAYSAAPEITS